MLQVTIKARGMVMQWFSKQAEDGPAYQRWLKDNPDGYVLHYLKPPSDPTGSTVHLARCHFLSGSKRPNVRVTLGRKYIKFCSLKYSDLEQEFKRKAPGKLLNTCFSCTPRDEWLRGQALVIPSSEGESSQHKVEASRQQDASKNHHIKALEYSLPKGLDGPFWPMTVTDSDHQELKKIEATEPDKTVREALYLARVGQGKFRAGVREIERLCRMTRIENHDFLIASHIKPWRSSSNVERLDGHNGLLLAPHVDRLFDRGDISFEDDGSLLVRDQKTLEIMTKWQLPVAGDFGPFSDRQKSYLAYHREHVFGH